MRRHLPPALVRGVLLPGWKVLRRDPVLRYRQQLEEEERWSEDLRAKRRMRLLSDLLDAAREKVPVWRERMPTGGPIHVEEAPSLLESLATTDKSTYQGWGEQAYEQGGDSGWIASSTGGSTGEPFYFRCDLSAAPWRRANTARCLGWLGIEPGDPTAVLWGFALGAGKWHEFRGGIRNRLSNQLTLSSFAMDPGELDRHVDRLRAFRPSLIVGYPSALVVLAEHAARTGASFPGLRAALSSGESLFEPQRLAIERGFGVPLFNRYGSREFANVAHECPERSGLHVMDDLMWIEVLDEQGRAVPPGKLGELVVTDLHNHVMPFIRYRTGDLAEWSQDRCPCGRPQPLLRRIEGRSFDVILTPDGTKVGGYFWTWLSRAVPGIQAFQVYQDSPAGVELRVVTGTGWEPSAVKTLEDHVRATCGPEFRVEIRLVEQIPLTPSGKHRFILSRLGSAS